MLAIGSLASCKLNIKTMAKKKTVSPETIYDETQLLHPAENTGVYGPCWTLHKKKGMQDAGMHAYSSAKDFTAERANVLEGIIEEYSLKGHSLSVRMIISIVGNPVVQKPE